MASVKPNALAIEKALKDVGKPRTQREIKVEGTRGLSLVVKGTGTVSWLVRYQVGKGEGRRVRRASVLGRYGAGGLDLAKARKAAESYWEAASEGKDKADLEKAVAFTLADMFELRKAEDHATDLRTLGDYERVLKRYVFPTLGNSPATSITPENIAPVLRAIGKKSPTVMHRARSALGGTYSWAQSHHPEKIVANPVAVLKFHYASPARKRDLTEAELRKLWAAIDMIQDDHGFFDGMGNLLRLAILTGQRNSEVAGMLTTELDLSAGDWNIPAHRMKRKTADQYVALSRQASAIIQEQITGSPDGKFVFPGSGRGRKGDVWRAEHTAQQSVSRAFAKVRDKARLKDLRLHDMRKVLVTWLAENDHAEPHVLDAILHHGGKGVTATHYNHARHKAKVRHALQTWADHVTGSAANAQNVVQLRA